MPIAAWCLLIVALMPLLPAGYAKRGADYDNREPRKWMDSLEGSRRRAYAAHLNCYEALPLFGAALFVAVWTDAPPHIVDALAVIFVLCRIAYIFAYIGDRATLRSTIWSLGMLADLGIFLSGLLPHP